MLSPALERAGATFAEIKSRRVISFGGCNYLGLAHHPEVIDAAARAAARYGLSTSASRTTTGNTAEHEALEADLAHLIRTDAALLLPDGFTANIAAAQGLRPGIGSAVLDERAHRSLHDAARAAGLRTATYRHRDAAHAGEVARSFGAPVVMMTDGVFAADGSVAPLPALLEALPDSDSRLLVDDCHGFMVLGDRGQGTPAALGLKLDHRVVVTTTLAKGLGCAGGAVLGTDAFIAGVREHASVFVCTTPPSPALVGAAREALRVSEREPHRRDRLRDNARRLHGDDASSIVTPILAATPGDARSMRVIHRELLDAGLSVPLISYPGGPAPEYFRVSVTSGHTPDQIERVVRAMRTPRHTDTNAGDRS